MRVFNFTETINFQELPNWVIAKLECNSAVSHSFLILLLGMSLFLALVVVIYFASGASAGVTGVPSNITFELWTQGSTCPPPAYDTENYASPRCYYGALPFPNASTTPIVGAACIDGKGVCYFASPSPSPCPCPHPLPLLRSLAPLQYKLFSRSVHI
jgi:hypothetical protein